MKVKLINHTPEPERTVALSGRLCYSSVGIDELNEKLSDDYVVKMIKKLVASGHHSTLEHISFTFAVEGVSRALTHQLVRHRVASYSQQSQRYVKETQFDYIVPDTIVKAGMKDVFEERMKIMQEWYTEALKAGVPAEDARFYLPNASETKIIVTMNARELIHFIKHRICTRAQWEIRHLAGLMLTELKVVAPNIFNGVGPSCVSGPCPEGEFCCGKVKEMREIYGMKKGEENE